MGVSLNQLKKRLQKVNQNKLQNEVRDLVISDQTIYDAKMFEFERGLAPDGGIIGEYSWPDYEREKAIANPLAGGNVDLILSGSFTRQLYIKYLGNGRFQFDSRDEKAPILFNRNYINGVNGKVLRTINPDTWDDLQKKEYAPKLINYIKQITGL